MTKSELIKELDKFQDHEVVVISIDGEGWSNIDQALQWGSSIMIVGEQTPVFSES